MTSSQIQQHTLKKSLKNRHLVMISLGGVIGSGLFLSSGYTINQAGPGGAIIAYLIGGLVMYLTMLCLGELSVALPDSGSFQSYATKLISPAVGFTIGWLYWLNWALTVGIELTSIGILMKRWFPDTPVWIWCLVVGLALFLFNAFSTRGFAETEFWLSSIKVLTILLFIILGGAALFGFIPLKDGASAPMLSHFTDQGGLFPNGFEAVLFAMIAVSFSFQGTEVIGITSGESENPEKTIPKAIKNTIWRTIFFYVLTITLIAGLIPWNRTDELQSPFVKVFDYIGIPYAADLMNLVMITALFSVANSGVYACSRMLWSMSQQQLIHPFFSKLSKKGIPLRAIIFTMILAGLSLLTSVIAEETVYVWLLSISSFAGVSVWASIGLSAFRFRKQYLASGKRVQDLKYRTPFFPLVPVLTFLLNTLVLVSLAFIPDQRMALYCGVPFTLGLLIFYKWKEKRQQRNQKKESVARVA